MTADAQLYVRDGSRFVPLGDAVPTWMRDVPPIPVPKPVHDDDAPEPARRSTVTVNSPRPPCGKHIAAWAVYTGPTGRPACKLCDKTRRTRR